MSSDEETLKGIKNELGAIRYYLGEIHGLLQGTSEDGKDRLEQITDALAKIWKEQDVEIIILSQIRDIVNKK